MFQLAIIRCNKGRGIQPLLLPSHQTALDGNIILIISAKALNIDCPQGAGAIHLLPNQEASIQT